MDMVLNTVEDVSVKDSMLRFSDSYFYAPKTEVLVLGLGGIGSWLALSLGRLDCKMYLFDYDNVEAINIAGQLFMGSQEGLSKVRAIEGTVNRFCDMSAEIQGFQKYTKDSFTGPIVFSCFDNMEARKLAFEKWAEEEDRELFVDGRMQMITGEVYCVIKGREDLYRATLFGDDEIEEAPCNAKASSFSGMTIAGLMTGIFANYLGLKKDSDLPVDLPFKTTYNYPLMLFQSYEQ
mgnify:CR=1 FL=1